MADELKNLVGANVRVLRARAGLTQDELAARLQRQGWDLARGTLAKIEAGVRRVNDAELVLLASGLKTDLSDLFRGTTPKIAVRLTRQGRD